MNVDGYVDTVAPLADDPALQKAVADALTKQVNGALDVDQMLPGSLPALLGDFTGPLSAQLEGLTGKLTREAVSSSAFREFWVNANRKIHPVLVEAIKSKGKVRLTTSDLAGLDLAEVTARVTDLLATSGVSLPEPLPQALTTGEVTLLDARPFARAGVLLLALDRLHLVLPLVTIALLLGSVLVDPRPLRGAVYLGAGLALAMVALELGIAAGRLRYLGATDDAGIPHAASAAIWGALTGDLRRWGWAVLVMGIAVAVAAALVLLVVRRSSRGPQPPDPVYLDYLYPPGGTPPPRG